MYTVVFIVSLYATLEKEEKSSKFYNFQTPFTHTEWWLFSENGENFLRQPLSCFSSLLICTKECLVIDFHQVLRAYTSVKFTAQAVQIN